MDNTFKISKITADNYKAIISQTVELNGCSVIVTAKNDSGKTSLLRGLIDRFRSIIPEFPVNKNADKGTYTMELTNGEKLEWRFSEKSEQINLYTSSGLKITSGVVSFLSEKYFGKQFSINDFLRKSEAEKIKYIISLLGVDVSEIDKEYKRLYDERTGLNRDLKNEKGKSLQEPEKLEKPDTQSLKNELQIAKDKNNALLGKWENDNRIYQENIFLFNEEQRKLNTRYEEAQKLIKDTEALIDRFVEFGIDVSKNLSNAINALKDIKVGQDLKYITNLDKPKLLNIDEIQEKINNANRQEILFNNYERDKASFVAWSKSISDIQEKIDNVNKEMEALKTKKEEIFKNANIPEEFKITEEGQLLYNDLPLTEAQISTSGLYIAALKLGKLGLGQLKAMHFEASALDKDNLEKVLEWATKEDLQLLIERPDYEGNKNMTFKLIGEI